jgi:hypothetical protein
MSIRPSRTDPSLRRYESTEVNIVKIVENVEVKI